MAGMIVTVGKNKIASGVDFDDLTLAFASVTAGMTIRLLPGTYPFSQLASAVANVTVEGVGTPDSVVLQSTDATDGDVILDINHAGWTFRNLTIQGASAVGDDCNLLDATTTPDLVRLESVKLTYQGTHECRLAGNFWVDAQCVLFSAYNVLTSGSFAAERLVTYGGADGGYAAKHLQYLNSGTGNWTPANATAVGSGERRTLGIAMAAAVAGGVMLRGYHNIEGGQLTGAWLTGGDLWMDTTAGHFAADGSQPSVAGNVSRYLGSGTNQANTFYFEPSGDWGVVGA